MRKQAMRKHRGNRVVGEALIFSPGEKIVAVVPPQLSVPEFREQMEQEGGTRCLSMATHVIGYRKCSD